MGPLICVLLNSTNYIVFIVDLGERGGVDEKKLLFIICRVVHFKVADIILFQSTCQKTYLFTLVTN